KRILIFSHSLELGGVEKALLGLLEGLDPSEYEIDLFLMRHSGELMKYIPSHVRLLPEIPAYASMAVPPVEALNRGQLRVLAGRVRGKIAARRFRRRAGTDGGGMVEILYSHRYTIRAMPRAGDGRYDLAISFLTPHYYVAEKVEAEKKAAWIHTDYSALATDVPEEEKMWSKFDRIVAVSDASAATFGSVFPLLKPKLTVCENRLPLDYMNGLETAFDVSSEMPDDGRIKLLSVGRFCEAKNFDSIPSICKRILAKGLNIVWYIIGFGGDEGLIRRRIAEEGMGRSVIILGKKENPYPYMKACDVYLQPSRYEGRCVAVQEAQVLGKPVIIADYPSSASQLTNGVDGWIVPLETEKCADGISALLSQRGKLAEAVKAPEAFAGHIDISFLTGS
ncbi:MAG: glycosyltransferase, partial [Clostridia bacterium]|nr:glycosyltransferase [Clostridia bacterium]